MEFPHYFLNPKLGEIPDLFKSHSDGTHLDHCIMCDQYLLEEGKNYLIEKAIRKYPEYEVADCIFEYAICFDCAQKMQENVSKESMEKVNAFFETNVNFPKRSLELYEDQNFNIEEWTDQCVVNGTARHDCEEYQVYGHFSGDKMIYSYFPYMISHEAIDALTELLSKETKDELDDFINEHFGLPPEYKDLLKDRPLVLV